MTRLISHYGGLVACTRGLGVVNHQTVDNWRRRGIPAPARPRLWAHYNSLAVSEGDWDELDVDWLVNSTANHEESHGRTRTSKSRKAE
jgi:hypothetical protein